MGELAGVSLPVPLVNLDRHVEGGGLVVWGRGGGGRGLDMETRRRERGAGK